MGKAVHPSSGAERRRRLLRQLFRFGIVGGAAAGIDWCVLALCVRALGMDSMAANVLSFLISAPYNYWMSTKYVFDFDSGRASGGLFLAFVALAAAGFGINELVLWVGDKRLALDPLCVKVAGIVLAAAFNFLTRKLILEKRGRQTP